jgi:hypothetical protein
LLAASKRRYAAVRASSLTFGFSASSRTLFPASDWSVRNRCRFENIGPRLR